MDFPVARSWRWFRTRLTYLLAVDGPLAKALRPPPEEPEPPTFTDDFEEG